MMKTRKNSFPVKKLIIFFIFSLSVQICFAATSNTSTEKWIIAAEQFSFTQKKNDSISTALTSVIPAQILDKIGNSLYRTLPADENYERQAYKLKNDRISLFLQLSSEIKKRDTLVLNNYTEKELKSKLEEEDKKIQEIKEKIDENLSEQKKIEEKHSGKTLENIETETSFTKKTDKIKENKNGKIQEIVDEYSTFFKHVFTDSEEDIIEKITLYKDDFSALFVPSQVAKKEGYDGKTFQKEILNSKINSLLTGQITNYGDYLFVTVNLHLYPGANVIATVSEVGTIDELDIISENIARFLYPKLTNSMPISIYVNITPQEAVKNAKLYIDEVLIQNLDNAISLDSGVHFIQVMADEYKKVGTNYFFTGNRKYQIDITLEDAIQGELLIKTKQNLDGHFYVNGMESIQSEDKKASIKINGESILGQFITENGESAFFYIPEEYMLENKMVSINAEIFNRSDYIEERRKKMYSAYSYLIISLIPHFIAKGESKARSDNSVLKYANYACSGISIGCGAWFVYNLVKYFISADSAIPEKAKIISEEDSDNSNNQKKNKNKNRKESKE